MAKSKKRKQRRNVSRGVAHIQSTFNNTIVTITDTNGDTLCYASAVLPDGRSIVEGGEYINGTDVESALGAIYDPTRKELFTGERGQGSFVNGTRLHVSGTATLLDSLLVTGFPYDVHQKLVPLLAMFGAFLGQARAVRRLGSAALDLCYVAAGRFDGFWEQTLKPWDVAAGLLIATEAGAHYGRRLPEQLLLAATQDLASALITTL